jgi:SAM-dependent methyltransferase
MSPPESPTDKCTDKCYTNQGNEPILERLDPRAHTILDVGCGAGDNARRLKKRDERRKVYGITLSEREKTAAAGVLDECWVRDVETDDLSFLDAYEFDALLFSHVLEHLAEPWDTVRTFSDHLVSGGQILIAVPNVLNWKTRLQFLVGRFEYAESGIMDETHLRFFTPETAQRYLLGPVAEKLADVEQHVEGYVPQPLWRRHVELDWLAATIDEVGCRLFPNLFGQQIVLDARKR